MPAFTSLLAFGLPGHGEWLLLILLGLLIFGRRLPEVGRSIGRSIVEFKRGIKGIEDDIEGESGHAGKRLADPQHPTLPRRDERAQPAAPQVKAEPRVPQAANDEPT
jgi:sec-independent protein translocase protein TatA